MKHYRPFCFIRRVAEHFTTHRGHYRLSFALGAARRVGRAAIVGFVITLAEPCQAFAQNVPGSLSAVSADDAYRKGDEAYGRKDYTSALTWWRKAAELGNAEAQISVGKMYYNGDGVPQDYAQAMTWYRSAAGKGYARAYIYIGWMYERGLSVTKDYSQAVIWYRKGADEGDPKAQFYLGTMYDRGFGVVQDKAEALAWYRKAADGGNTSAKMRVAERQANFDINLMCIDQSGQRSFVFVDTSLKYVKLEGRLPAGKDSYYVVIAVHDGVTGKVLKEFSGGGSAIDIGNIFGAAIVESALDLEGEQFVRIDNDNIVFGVRTKQGTSEHTINLRSGIHRIDGQVVSTCSMLSTKR